MFYVAFLHTGSASCVDGLWKIDDLIAFVGQFSFFSLAVAAVGKFGNVKGKLFALCQKGHHIPDMLAVSGVLGEEFHRVLVDDLCLHGLQRSKALMNRSHNGNDPYHS